jgi:hypothetical protein
VRTLMFGFTVIGIRIGLRTIVEDTYPDQTLVRLRDLKELYSMTKIHASRHRSYHTPDNIKASYCCTIGRA